MFNNTDNDGNNDFKRPDNLTDGTEDANHNGRIDGDNGDGINAIESEKWKETSPNLIDSDGDSFSDKEEKSWGYNPLSTDSDGDGISDDNEDENGNGQLDSGETDPTKMDTDGDGLLDKQELEGWTVVIIKEATGEQINRYSVTSDPRKVHSDNDNIDDFAEFKNATDPNKEDTDGDGKSDYIEIIEYEDSSPWGIDGVAPNITKIEKSYEKRFGGYTGLKLIGVDVKLTISCRDDFGMDWINVKLSGEGEEKAYFSGNTEVKHTFTFRSDNYAKILWSGFDVNITASDVNYNVGYKESEVKGIIKAAFDALVGVLLSFAKVIMELISKMCDWVFDLPKQMLDTIISTATKLKDSITSLLKSFVDPIIEMFSNPEGTKSGVGFTWVDFIDVIFNFPFFIALGVLAITVFVIEKIVDGVSFGSQTIILSVLMITLGILISMLLATPEAKEAMDTAVTSIIDAISIPLDFVGLSLPYKEDIKFGIVEFFKAMASR